MISAVVLGYSEVGYRCLRGLLDHGVRVPLVLTHADSPGETQWYGSVAELARSRGVEVATPAKLDDAWIARLQALRPDYLFSFYYRSMLPAPVLATAQRAALNMHGSLLPRYRGRAPVNWALLNGETETGATLHYMVDKPDAGPIVDQEAIAIGIDDTALDVSLRLAEAAERLLVRCLPALAAGAPPGKPMDLAQGSYFGGRKPEDGRIDWGWPAKRVHDLIRAVAPPFPGAFTDVPGARGPRRIVFGGSHWTGERAAHQALAPCLYPDDRGTLRLDCADGLRLDISWLTVDGVRADAASFGRLHGTTPLRLAANH